MARWRMCPPVPMLRKCSWMAPWRLCPRCRCCEGARGWRCGECAAGADAAKVLVDGTVVNVPAGAEAAKVLVDGPWPMWPAGADAADVLADGAAASAPMAADAAKVPAAAAAAGTTVLDAVVGVDPDAAVDVVAGVAVDAVAGAGAAPAAGVEPDAAAGVEADAAAGVAADVEANVDAAVEVGTGGPTIPGDAATVAVELGSAAAAERAGWERCTNSGGRSIVGQWLARIVDDLIAAELGRGS